MGINYKQIGAGIKRRREQLGLTQDNLAAKIGVRWNTIARIEIGNRRPSLDLLELVANVFQCQVRDLIKEEKKTMVTTRHEASMQGAPTYFRVGIQQASERAFLGSDVNSGWSLRSDYSVPGYHLAIHLHEYLNEEAEADLGQVEEGDPKLFSKRLLAFLDREFPGCMALVPSARRDQFMKGVLQAIHEHRFPIDGENVEGLRDELIEMFGEN